MFTNLAHQEYYKYHEPQLVKSCPPGWTHSRLSMSAILLGKVSKIGHHIPWIVDTGWWFGTCFFFFPEIFWEFLIIPSDLFHIFSEGLKPQSRSETHAACIEHHSSGWESNRVCDLSRLFFPQPKAQIWCGSSFYSRGSNFLSTRQ